MNNLKESLRFTNKMGISSDIVNETRNNTKVIITADKKEVLNYSIQIMLEISTNILAKIFPNIEIDVEDVPAKHLNTSKNLYSHLIKTKNEAYKWNQAKGETQNYIYLVVGNKKVSEKAIYIDANGWLAYVGNKPSNIEKKDIRIPIGSVASACLGAAEIFKLIFNKKIKKDFNLIENIIFNTLTYKFDDETNIPVDQLNLDRVALFGSGSVGSSLLYTLGFMPNVSGTIDIVDRDPNIDINNMQRYSYLTLSDLEKNQSLSKARWAANKIDSDLENLKVNYWDKSQGTVSNYLNSRPLKPRIKLAISAVDNINARIEIADCLAERTINAGTGDVTLTITRHGFSDGKACLACDYISNIPSRNWYQKVSRETGLSVGRVAQLLQGGEVLVEDDIKIMINKRFIEKEKKDKLLNTDLNSIVNRKLYSSVSIDNKNSTESSVTAPFVSTMSGALLTGEMIKEIAGLQGNWKKNKFRMDMLIGNSLSTSVPKAGIKCLCANNFRKQSYENLWDGNR